MTQPVTVAEAAKAMRSAALFTNDNADGCSLGACGLLSGDGEAMSFEVATYRGPDWAPVPGSGRTFIVTIRAVLPPE